MIENLLPWKFYWSSISSSALWFGAGWRERDRERGREERARWLQRSKTREGSTGENFKWHMRGEGSCGEKLTQFGEIRCSSDLSCRTVLIIRPAIWFKSQRTEANNRFFCRSVGRVYDAQIHFRGKKNTLNFGRTSSEGTRIRKSDNSNTTTAHPVTPQTHTAPCGQLEAGYLTFAKEELISYYKEYRAATLIPRWLQCDPQGISNIKHQKY